MSQLLERFSRLTEHAGPTAPAYLLHSQATISSRIYENYDQRYNHTFQVSKSGDGFIQVQKPANEEQQVVPPKPIDVHVERDVIETLLNAYFSDIAPMLPIISKAEFLATPNPAPVLLYSMCLVAAARREVPQKIFDSIRYTVNNIIKAEDVLSTASIVNVQALLILCMTGDCHSQFVPSALSGLWIRLGSAIRMVRRLGSSFGAKANFVHVGSGLGAAPCRVRQLQHRATAEALGSMPHLRPMVSQCCWAGSSGYPDP